MGMWLRFVFLRFSCKISRMISSWPSMILPSLQSCCKRSEWVLTLDPLSRSSVPKCSKLSGRSYHHPCPLPIQVYELQPLAPKNIFPKNNHKQIYWIILGTKTHRSMPMDHDWSNSSQSTKVSKWFLLLCIRRKPYKLHRSYMELLCSQSLPKRKKTIHELVQRQGVRLLAAKQGKQIVRRQLSRDLDKLDKWRKLKTGTDTYSRSQ